MAPKENNCVIREASRGIANLTERPSGLVLWLKFDSEICSIDSSNLNFLVTSGNPRRLPKHYGIYNNWGCYFDFGDCLEVPGHGLEITSQVYSVSFFMVCGGKLQGHQGRDKSYFQTLLQPSDGIGGQLVVDSTPSGNLGFFDTLTGDFYQTGVRLNRIDDEIKWQHICVIIAKQKK